MTPETPRNVNKILDAMCTLLNYGAIKGYPKIFQSDLVRDGAWVQRNTPDKFYWVIYEAGTHITESKTTLDEILDHFDERIAGVFHWNGECFKEYYDDGKSF